LLSALAVACKPVFEGLSIDKIKRIRKLNINHIGSGWREVT
jgi:hypothetical protein